ncbi:MAG: hypothetical protein ABGX37_07865 [Methylococcales bacterium]|jgi:hypothetical protein
MRKYNPDPAVKKVRYITSIIYLLVLGFIVGGSYLHQQDADTASQTEDADIIWTNTP